MGIILFAIAFVLFFLALGFFGPILLLIVILPFFLISEFLKSLFKK